MTEKHDEQLQVEKEELKTTASSAESEIDSSILAAYEILELIGQGGFGSVYRARDKKSSGEIALKIVRKNLANSEVAFQRMGEEAKAITALSHENIVGVREFGTGSEGSAYLVMDYIQGLPLQEEIALQKLSIQECLNIAIQICKGLNHAHSKGILHRDLKPANILLVGKSPDLSVKIVDFGIAKIANDVREQNLTQTGDIVGSPYYMSPEQGQGFVLDPRADIYSLGCMIYEMLCWQVPHKGKTPMQTLLKQINDPAPKMSETAPARAVPAAIEAVVLKMLEKNPADRYQTVAELQADLQLLKEGKAPGLVTGSADSKAVTKAASRKLHPLALTGMVFAGFLIAFLLFFLISYLGKAN